MANNNALVAFVPANNNALVTILTISSSIPTTTIIEYYG